MRWFKPMWDLGFYLRWSQRTSNINGSFNVREVIYEASKQLIHTTITLRVFAQSCCYKFLL